MSANVVLLKQLNIVIPYCDYFGQRCEGILVWLRPITEFFAEVSVAIDGGYLTFLARVNQQFDIELLSKSNEIYPDEIPYYTLAKQLNFLSDTYIDSMLLKRTEVNK
jgi:hypothetical protein